MANGSVTFLLTKLSEFVERENELLNGIEADITFMEDGLAMSSAFLSVAEVSEEHNNNELIKAWVKNVRETNFDMKDVLDEIKLKFAHSRGPEGICATSFDRTCHFIQSLKARRQIAKRMQGIRIRMNDISERYRTLETSNIWRGINEGGAMQLNDRPDALLDEANLVGITEAKNRIIQWLLRGKLDREVVSVVGEGGLGKTTLIKQVYDDAEVKKHFKFRAWITLTRHFETVDLLKDMLQQLFRVMRRPSPSELDSMSIPSLRNEINDFLRRRRYLIVLDDVWEQAAWDTFQMAFPNNSKGSRILLTTQILPVANHFCSESRDKIYRMRPLSRQESWALFCNHTFQQNPCPPNLLNISGRILSRCEGLPLAIVAISGVLATIDTSMTDEWEMVLRTLGADTRGGSLGRMREALLCSYYFLPSYLRSCLLYLSIFPEGYPIEKMRLIRLWIAEGFVTRSEGRTLEEVAESYLNGLNDTFRQNPCPPNLLNISGRILSRCEGLPLAIVAISGVLATIDTSMTDEWEMVLRTLGADTRGGSLGRMREALLCSYYFLPSYLRSCLLYLSIFPEGYPIEKMRLIRLWIAEGFVTRSEGRTLEEVAESYLNGLIERSLIQVVEMTSDDRVKQCRIQGVLREIIISKAKDLSFAAIVTDIVPERVRRLSIHNAMGVAQEAYFKSRLCSLFVFWGLEPSPESLPFSLTCTNLRMLFVLDLGGTPLVRFPDEITSLLLLKYLSLRDTKVSSIPSSIYKLQDLETLDLKNSRVTELPSSIVKLQRLRHLLVYRRITEVDDHLQTKYTIGFKLLTHIRGLQSLQKLCFIEPSRNTNILQQVGTLGKLRRLGIVNMREEDGEILCSSIEKLTNLRALSVSSIRENEVINLNHIHLAPPFLQRLYLTGSLRTLPRWISSLDNLKKLVLKWSRLPGNPLPDLQRLPNLLHLEFLEAYDGEALRFDGGFGTLKFLGIHKLDRLKDISVRQGAMPCLKKLIVQRCQLLKKVPSGIEHLHQLKVIEFINMPIELIMTLHPDRDEFGDYRRVARVPEVNFYTYWNNGSWDVFSLERFREEILAQLDQRIVITRTLSRQLSAVAIEGGGRALTPIIGMVSAIIIIAAIVYQWQR